MFCMAEKHWYQWTISVFQSCTAVNHVLMMKMYIINYWSSSTVYIGCDEIGASVELDILAQQMVIVNIIRIWIKIFYAILSHLLGLRVADPSLCPLLFIGSYTDRLAYIADSSNQTLSFTASHAVFTMLNMTLFSIFGAPLTLKGAWNFKELSCKGAWKFWRTHVYTKQVYRVR